MAMRSKASKVKTQLTKRLYQSAKGIIFVMTKYLSNSFQLSLTQQNTFIMKQWIRMTWEKFLALKPIMKKNGSQVKSAKSSP